MIFETLKLWAKAVVLGDINVSYYTLPVLWVLCLVPHLFARFIYTTSTGQNVDFFDLKSLAPTAGSNPALPPRVHAQVSRAETVAADTAKCVPIFAAAVLAGNQVGLSNGLLNAWSLAYVLTRVVYIDASIFCESLTMAVLRVILSFTGHCIICMIFILAGISWLP
jgi:uncharacterized MAPEG superfamily protein